MRKEVFDQAKKVFDLTEMLKREPTLEEIKQGFDTGDGSRPYENYLTNGQWEDFLTEMKKYKDVFDTFSNSPGGELEKHFNGRWNKMMPPKMASFASSSRMIYLLSREIPRFEFEKSLPICIYHNGIETVASLDGYCDLGSKEIYVEAKCHEFYSSNSTKFKDKYLDFYSYLEAETCGSFKYLVDENPKTPVVRFSWKGTSITQFDLKQVLCHLLGIAKQSLLEKGKKDPVLLYLVYNPDDLLKIVETIDKPRTAHSILNCWKKERDEFFAIDFNLLFKKVLFYLHDKLNICQSLSNDEVERIAKSFSCVFCDQHDYLSHIQ